MLKFTDGCGCDIIECMCPEFNRQVCQALHPDLFGTPPPNCNGDNCTCTDYGDDYYYNEYYDDTLCCYIGNCTQVCPTCPGPDVVCDPVYEDLITYAALPHECCPTYACECKDAVDLDSVCHAEEHDITCASHKEKYHVGPDPSSYGCCDVYACRCLEECIHNGTTYAVGDVIYDGCDELTCVYIDEINCYDFVDTGDTPCLMPPEPCHNDTFVIISTGYDDVTCCPTVECECYYVIVDNGTILEPGDTYSNDTCQEYVVRSSDGDGDCPYLHPIPYECPPVICDECEVQIYNGTSDCCGDTYICESICVGTVPDCGPNGTIVLSDMLECNDCCPRYECISNCTDHVCGTAPNCPLNIAASYPVVNIPRKV